MRTKESKLISSGLSSGRNTNAYNIEGLGDDLNLKDMDNKKEVIRLAGYPALPSPLSLPPRPLLVARRSHCSRPCTYTPRTYARRFSLHAPAHAER